MFCTKCGKEISDSSSVCTYCGTQVGSGNNGNYGNNNGNGYTNNQQNQSPYIQADTSPLSMGDYLIMMLLLSIPIVNIILLFIWAFSMDTNVNKKNYARATLILFAVSSVILTVLWGSLIATVMSFV